MNEILLPSLKVLYSVDYDNIRFGVSERNICARLAHHMENHMRKYDQLNGVEYFEATLLMLRTIVWGMAA